MTIKNWSTLFWGVLNL